MQRRLLRALLAVAIAGIAVLGAPLAVTVSRFLHDEATRRLESQAATIGFTVDDALEEGSPIPEASVRRLLTTGQRVTILAPGRERTVVDRGGANADLRARVRTSAGGQVILEGSDADVDARVHRAWGLVGALAAAGILAALVVAVIESRRLSRPLRALAGYSSRIGGGELAATTPAASGVAEIDEVGDALHGAAWRIAALLERERQFSSNASHQLRSPLTALRLRLEAMPGDDRNVVAAIDQVDRLDATIDQLLAFAREGRTGAADRVALEPLLDDEAARWRPLLDEAGRRLVVDGAAARDATARASRGALSQILDALVENARVHGGGTVTITARALPEHVVVSVEDEGSGVSDELAAHVFERSVSTGNGTGVGLSLARSLAEAEGGRLELDRRRPARFSLFLRRAADGAPGPSGGSDAA